MEYYDEATLEGIGNIIGTTLKVDTNTAQQARGKFSRICVEMDLDNPLVPFYEFDGDFLRFEYVGIHMVCLTCGRYGHSEEHCPESRKNDERQEEDQRGKDGASNANVWQLLPVDDGGAEE